MLVLYVYVDIYCDNLYVLFGFVCCVAGVGIGGYVVLGLCFRFLDFYSGWQDVWRVVAIVRLLVLLSFVVVVALIRLSLMMMRALGLLMLWLWVIWARLL